jgi:AraC-type DNA-binding domain-containing proteins
VRYPVLVKMILTICLLICVPMIVVQVLILQSSYSALNSKNDSFYLSEGQKLSSMLSSQMTDYRTVALKISNTNQTNIKKYFDSDDPNVALAASEELANYLRCVPLAKHLGLYYINKQTFLDDQYYYRLDNFCNSFSNGSSEVYQKIHSLFTDPPDSRYLVVSSLGATNSPLSELLIAFPVKMKRSGEYDAVVYFTITYSSINSYLNSFFTENCTCAVFNRFGSLVMTNNTENFSELLSKKFTDYLSLGVSRQYQFHDEENSVSYKWTDEESPYQFIIIAKQSQLEQNNLKFYQNMRLILLINLVLTGILVAVTAYINYNPIHRLVARLASRNSGTKLSELDQIESTIEELDTKASDQSLVIMDYVLNDLLYGAPEFRQPPETLVPALDYQDYCAVCVSCSRPNSEQSHDISSQILRASGYQIYITDMPNRDFNLLVCLSRESIDTARLTEAILASVQTVLKESCKVSLGTIVHSLNEIPLSYYASISDFAENACEVFSKEYPSSDIGLFARHVAARNTAGARELLGAIAKYASINSKNRTLCRFICYDVLVAYVSARKQCGYPITESELKGLLAFINFNQLEKELSASLDTMEQLLSERDSDETTELQNQILGYVDQNCRCSALSLVEVADRFGISIYTVSRIFKSKIGIGFKEYVTAKRLDTACRLLLTTSDTICVISQNCGFENPTYFTSIFKSHYGLTPTNFRQGSSHTE